MHCNHYCLQRESAASADGAVEMDSRLQLPPSPRVEGSRARVAAFLHPTLVRHAVTITTITPSISCLRVTPSYLCSCHPYKPVRHDG